MTALVTKRANEVSQSRLKTPSAQNLLQPISETLVNHGTGAKEAKNVLDCTELHSIFSDGSFERHFQPNSTILLHGDPADAVYLVKSGTVRCCTIGEDGGRQIFGFAQKGDFIGIADIDEWHFTAEAVDHVILSSISREIVEHHLRVNSTLRQEFRARLSFLIEQREEQLLFLISKKATDRLFRFLREFASSRLGDEHGTVALPMSRRDIADHLGLSVETVSRAFGDLKLHGRIELITSEKYRLLQGYDHTKMCSSATVAA